MGVSQAPSAGALSVGGRVLDAASQRPVAGAAVTIRGVSPLPDPPTLVADAGGRFRFDRLRPGRYTIVATAVGYLQGGAHSSDGMPPTEVAVTLETGVSRTDLRIELVKPASIAGFVFDSDNTPVESAQMGALREVYVAGRRRFAIGSSTSSNDAGEFRFGGLAPGRYVVCVIGERLTVPRAVQSLVDDALAGTQEELADLSLVARQSGMQLGANRAFAVGDFWLKPGNVSVGPLVTSDGAVWSAPDTCNGSARNPLNAPLIVVTAGEQHLGETLIVDLERAPSVSGVVTGPAGPMAWQGVTLESEGFDALGWTEGLPYATTTTDGAGRFTLLGVAPGNYMLRTYRVPTVAPGTPPGTLPEGETLSARLPISVGRDDLADVGVVMASAVQPRGRVVFKGSAAPPPDAQRARVALSFASADGAIVRRALLRPTVVVHPDGRFQTAGLMAGRYIVTVAPMGPWRIDTAELNGVDVSDVPFVVNEDPQPEIVITLTDTQWRVAGTVRDDKSLPVAEGHVVLFPADRNRWVDQGAEPRRQRLAEVRDGAYAVEGLPAGDYLVVALPAGAAGDWQSPERFTAWEIGATRITVGRRESRTLDLTLGGER
jgi:protocatechuate 3,4-dioxygenase beta subunit